mmetsp:Transcript_34291/g.83008  ORF Transcript_34291/g.83008 Transcript_34291/m.83008 type:complete len:362 (-) Transcript_34291:246-1331(-)
MMNRGLLDLTHSEVLARSTNPEHAPRFDMGDFPPLGGGGSSGMMMGKGDLDALSMGGHGLDTSVLMRHPREEKKIQDDNNGRMWWPNGILGLDSPQEGKSSFHPDPTNPDFMQNKDEFPALPSLKSRQVQDSSHSIHNRLQRNLGDPKGKINGGNAMSQVPGPSKLLGNSSLFMPRNQEPLKPEAKAEAEKYGLKGLLSVIRMTDPALNTLALGTDLTKLGLNLNSSDSLYATFAYPCAENAARREPDFVLPYCYYMQPPALKTSHLGKFELLTLFYIFYNMPKDTLQVYAAKELYNRDWRYHKELKIWFTRPSESAISQHGYERGSLIYFDITSWEQRVFRDSQIPGGPKFMTEHELNTS